MRVEQRRWTAAHGWIPALPRAVSESAQLIFIFGASSILKDQKVFEQIRKIYPRAYAFGCSTAGEICGTQVTDDSLVVTAVHFDHTEIRAVHADLNRTANSYEAGKYLAETLPGSIPVTGSDEKKKLMHVLVLSDGLKVNGSELVRGLIERLPEGVTLTGGLAGDGERFEETLVLWDTSPQTSAIAALGLYGCRLKVGFGSLGGWDSFGPERLVTQSEGNVLYELDGHSALELYKKYLGEHAKDLPVTGLLFPLSLRTKTGETGVVRTILSIDENTSSMTFAGDVPEGSYVRFMKANFDRLIDGAVGAARTSFEAIGSVTPALAILISCVGRKLVLKQRIEEEVESVQDILGVSAILTGFYSYGEISPFAPGTQCELHNQTMTITTLSEE
jgi:hypothetical protein